MIDSNQILENDEHLNLFCRLIRNYVYVTFVEHFWVSMTGKSLDYLLISHLWSCFYVPGQQR